MRYITLISDTHLGPNKYFSIDVAIRAFKLAIDKASQSQLKILAHGGDLFDKVKVGATELDAISEIIEYAISKDVMLLLNPGNHCMDSEYRVTHAHLANYKLKNIITTNNQDPFHIKENNVLITLLPYGGPLDQAVLVGKGEAARLSILIAHEDVRTARYDNLAISTKGLSKSDVEEVLKYYKIFGLGHIHLPQTLYDLRRAFYIGAPHQFNFNSCGQKRGYMTVNMDGTYHRHLLTGGEWPEFKKVKADDIKDQSFENEFIMVKTDGADKRTNEEIQKLVGDLGAKRVKIDRAPVKVQVSKRSNINIHDDIRVIGKKYVGGKVEDELEQEELLKVHEELLHDLGI